MPGECCNKYHCIYKMKFFIKDFFSKYHQILSSQWIWSHLLKKYLMKTSFFVQCIRFIIYDILKNITWNFKIIWKKLCFESILVQSNQNKAGAALAEVNLCLFFSIKLFY